MRINENGTLNDFIKMLNKTNKRELITALSYQAYPHRQDKNKTLKTFLVADSECFENW